jgi:uroporphyrinogen decarboxylase
MAILPDLIEIGVDVLNVNQLALNGIDEIAARFAGQTCFMGGLDQQRILPFGTVEEVERHVQHVLGALGDHRGGYVAVALSGGGADVPFANLKAALEAFRRLGRYPMSVTTAV